MDTFDIKRCIEMLSETIIYIGMQMVYRLLQKPMIKAGMSLNSIDLWKVAQATPKLQEMEREHDKSFKFILGSTLKLSQQPTNPVQVEQLISSWH